MNWKPTAVGFGIGVVLLIIWGQMQYSRGRSSMRDEILAAPPVKDTTSAVVITIPTPDTMRGEMPATRRVIIRPDEQAGEIINEANVGALGAVYTDTLTDSHGGEHRLSFTFPSLVFDETYSPPADSTTTVTVTETRFVPSEPGEFWLNLSGSTRSGGITLGWRFIGVGIAFQRDADVWRTVLPTVSIHIPL